MSKKTRQSLPDFYTEHYRSKDSKPPSTGIVHQDRIPLFAPYKTLSYEQLATKKNPITVITSFGKIVFRNGRLDQTHRDILQILLTYYKEFGCYRDWLVSPEGIKLQRLSFEFSGYQLCKYLGVEFNNDWLYKKLSEMWEVQFCIVPDFNKDLAGHFGHGTIFCNALHFVRPTKDGKFWLEISPHFLEAYQFDTANHTESMTQEILSIKSAQVKALVNHCITHAYVHKSLSQVIVDIGLPAYTHDDLNNLRLHRKYKRLFTNPEIVKLLKEVFCINIYQSNPMAPKEWLVKFNCQDLDGKVWKDNELYLRHNRVEKVLKELSGKKTDTKTNTETNTPSRDPNERIATKVIVDESNTDCFDD